MASCNRYLLIAVGAACLWVSGTTASNAQVQRYAPSRPTVSPYLNLFRDQTGVLPNYQALVRPLQQQEDFNQQQRALNQRNAAVNQQLQNELFDLQLRQAAGPQMAPTGKGSWFQQPGQRHRFLDTSQFYSQSGSAGQRSSPRGATATRPSR